MNFKELDKQTEVDRVDRTLKTLTEVLIIGLIIWLILN